VPTPYKKAEGNIVGGASREPSADPARSENPGTHGISMRENREVSWSPVLEVMVGAGREGKAEAVIPRCTTMRSLTVP